APKRAGSTSLVPLHPRSRRANPASRSVWSRALAAQQTAREVHFHRAVDDRRGDDRPSHAENGEQRQRQGVARQTWGEVADDRASRVQHERMDQVEAVADLAQAGEGARLQEAREPAGLMHHGEEERQAQDQGGQEPTLRVGEEGQREEEQPGKGGNASRGTMARHGVVAQEEGDADQKVDGYRMVAQNANAGGQARHERKQAPTAMGAPCCREEEQTRDHVKGELVAERPGVPLRDRQLEDPRQQEQVREELQRVLRQRVLERPHPLVALPRSEGEHDQVQRGEDRIDAPDAVLEEARDAVVFDEALHDQVAADHEEHQYAESPEAPDQRADDRAMVGVKVTALDRHVVNMVADDGGGRKAAQALEGEVAAFAGCEKRDPPAAAGLSVPSRQRSPCHVGPPEARAVLCRAAAWSRWTSTRTPRSATI